MATHEENPRIYTIGHSNRRSDEILDLLKRYNIELLVDVRSSPYSFYVPQFNREKISLALVESGITYWYLGDCLGGRPKDPTCYKNGKLPEGKANYLELVNYGELAKRSWYKNEIDQLIKRANEHRIAIMCSEEDPNRCHRHHLITKTLLDKGIAVWHIRGQGTLEEAKFNTESKCKDDLLIKQKTLFDFV
jgi:uncharacterized protein (DUF488 family)